MDDNRQNRQSEVDQWLDAALQQRNAEPLMGLEERVLARLATEPERKTFTWWPVLVGVAALLLVVTALVLVQTGARDSRQVVRVPPPQPVSHSGAQPAVQSSNLKPAPSSLRRHLAAARTPHGGVRRSAQAVSRPNTEESLPKLATFPAARRQTREERLMAQLGERPEFYEQASTLIEKPVTDLSLPELRIDSVANTENSPPQ